MKFLLPLALSIAALLAVSALDGAEPEFPLTEDSKPHDNVPKGELIKFEFAQSKIFPGTTREVTIYVPKQYDGTKPACVYVNQDGVQWNAPVVFDNLIAKGDMPVTIGVFVRPGVVKALDGNAALDRFNRSFEYDGLGPDYARFILEEVLPAVEQKTTTDGRKIVLSTDGNDRAIGGSSSGAICAFIAAWEKPHAFSRVFNVVCTMVGLRGANVFPTLIRKYEPKPIRVFQQDGSNDNNIYGGDWWMANQELERALTFAGYEHDHVWGEGGHNGKHGTQVFPDAMRFLWKGWPARVKAGEGSPQLKEILIPGEEWQVATEEAFPSLKDSLAKIDDPMIKKFLDMVSSDLPEGLRLTTNARGEAFVSWWGKSEAGKQKEVFPLIRKIGVNGKTTRFTIRTKRGLSQLPGIPNGLAFGADGRLFATLNYEPTIVAFDEQGQETTVADGILGNDLVSLHNGNLYVTGDGMASSPSGSVWLLKPDGAKQVVDTGKGVSGGIATSPDQSLLYIADARSHWVYSYQIQPDGSLSHKQRYYHLHVPDTADDAGADGLAVDNAGRLYVATRMGLQVCDQAGRVNCIIPTPNGRASGVVFGGPELDTLYVPAGDRVYKRKVKARGAPSHAAPVKPAAPKL